MELTILHFNDLHGRLDQCPPLFTLIQRIRAEAQAAGRTVLVLDGGDSSDRARWESDITKGRANFKLLEAMGVQASVVGNGEALQWGRSALRNLAASVRFSVLAANLVDCAEPAQLAVPGLKRSCVLNLDGFKIGLVGVTAVYRNGYDRFGYRSADPLPPLQREVAALKAGGANFILLLSHLGYAPPEEKQKWLNPDDFTDDIAAAACPEINLVVGGHSHRKLEPPLRVGNTLIMQAGDYGRWLGQLDLTVEPETGRICDHTYTLHSTEGVPPDPALAATLAALREEADSMMGPRRFPTAWPTPCAKFATPNLPSSTAALPIAAWPPGRSPAAICIRPCPARRTSPPPKSPAPRYSAWSAACWRRLTGPSLPIRTATSRRSASRPARATCS
jgi:2',3'-cyclic-nucleotide 2'-phosphodiesterase (5'-nucleotidase family)